MAIRQLRMFQCIAMTGFLFFNIDQVRASTITYSWSGTLVLSNSSAPDPWGIGEEGALFSMATTVDAAALDGNSVQSPFAIFAATSARLWIDGEEASLVGTPWIDFTDAPEFPLVDAVTMAGDFSKNGQTVSFSTVVALSPLAYTFSSLVEVPPSFPSMLSVSQGAAGHPFYVAIVPEPATLGLAGVALAGVVAAARRFKA